MYELLWGKSLLPSIQLKRSHFKTDIHCTDESNMIANKHSMFPEMGTSVATLGRSQIWMRYKYSFSKPHTSCRVPKWWRRIYKKWLPNWPVQIWWWSRSPLWKWVRLCLSWHSSFWAARALPSPGCHPAWLITAGSANWPLSTLRRLKS